jgi:hypothetical protein
MGRHGDSAPKALAGSKAPRWRMRAYSDTPESVLERPRGL